MISIFVPVRSALLISVRFASWAMAEVARKADPNSTAAAERKACFMFPFSVWLHFAPDSGQTASGLPKGNLLRILAPCALIFSRRALADGLGAASAPA